MAKDCMNIRGVKSVQKQIELSAKEKLIKLLRDNHCDHMTFDTLFGVKIEYTITVTPHGFDIDKRGNLVDFDKLDNETLINLAYEVEQKIKMNINNNP